jgi:hypothetical protein
MIFRINMLGWWKVTILTAILVSGLRSLEVMADTVHKRTLDQLVSKDEPAWPLVKNWIRLAKNQVEVLPPDIKSRGDVLVQTQVTTKSPMGALIYETGGLIVDHGWLRILGSGHPKLPRSLPGWNRLVGIDLGAGPPPFLLVADDVVGGFYAIDGGSLGKPGNVFYYAPDSLKWEDTGKGYTDFIHFCLSGDLEKYYRDMRWPGWQADLSKIDGDQGVSIYPFPATLGPKMASRHRGFVPMSELYGLYVKDFPRKMF